MFLSSKFLNRLVATLLAIVATLSTAVADGDSGTGWSYDSKTKTLTLSGSNVEWSIIKAFDSTTENVVFADDYNVSNLPSYAFYRFRKLKTVKLPNVVTSIGSYAFCGCFSLESVEILSDGTSDSKHVIYLGDSTDQTSTGYLNFPRNQATLIYNPNTTWIGDNENQNLRYYFSDFVFSGGKGWSFDSKTKTLTLSGPEVAWKEIKGYSSTTENVVFAEDYSVSDIPANAFYEFTKLTSVDLPNVVKSIGDDAFSGCSSLVTVTLPEGLTSIGEGAFYECTSLASISLPASLTSIESSAFAGCTSLNSIEILSGGTSGSQHVIYLGSSSDKTAIGYSVFPRNQATLTYDPNTTWIGENENQNLRYYFSDIALSDRAGWSYDYATNTLTLSGSVVAWSAIKIFSSTTENVVFAEDYKVPDIPSEAFLDFSKLKAVELPDVVESIGTDAFYRCSSLASVTLPSSVTSIGREAFYGCSALASVTLPSSITSIDELVFGNCTSLATVTLPKNLISIGFAAFNGCTSLTSVTLPESLTSIDDFAFAGCTSLNSIEILSDGTSDNKHVIHLGSGSDKTARGYNVFPRNQATLKYDPTTTWVGDDDTQNFRYYFSVFEVPTSIHQTEISTSAPQFYDLGGRPVSPTSHQGLAVKRQGNNSSLITIK